MSIAPAVARYTGLPPDLIDRANLRIDPDVFRKQLLADQRLIIGRFDARVTGLDPNPVASYTEYDPSDSRSTCRSIPARSTITFAGN